jgi:hypothetical protein
MSEIRCPLCNQVVSDKRRAGYHCGQCDLDFDGKNDSIHLFENCFKDVLDE